MKYHQLTPSELETYNVGYMVGSHQIVITDTEWESDEERKIYRKGYYAGFKDWERKNKKNKMSTMSTKSTKEQMSTKSTLSTLSDLAQCPQQRGDYRGDDIVIKEKRDKGVIGGKEKGITIDWADVLDRWNRIANKYGLSQIKTLTEKRKKQFRARLEEQKLDTEQFFYFVNKALWTSPFLQGYEETIGDGGVLLKIENENKWKADFDFCLQSQSFSRMRENFYCRRYPERLVEFEELERQQGGTNAD